MVVAVKIMELGGCTPAQVASADKEVAVLCQICKRLGSCVVDFLGFQKTQTGRLLIVMKLARRSLMSLITESGRVPVACVVRSAACVLSALPGTSAVLRRGTKHVQL